MVPKFKTSVTETFPKAPATVTRFGEISPFWLNLQSLWQYFDGIFSIWQSCETALVNCVCHWAHFHCYK